MKITLSLFVFTVFIGASLTACTTHSGNIRARDQSVINNIKIGETTKAEVLTLMGPTSNIMRQGGKETWTYSYSETNIGARAFVPFANMVGEVPVGVTMSNVIVTFGENGVVEDVISRTHGNK